MASKTAKTTEATSDELQTTSDEPQLPLYRGGPSARYGYTLRDGTQRELAADDSGVVTPETAEDVAALRTFGLDVVIPTNTASGKKTTRVVERGNAPEPMPTPPAGQESSGQSESEG